MKPVVHYSVKMFFCFVFSNISSFYVAWSVLSLDSLFCLFEWQKSLNHSDMSFLNLKVAAAVWVWERSLLWIICLSFRASWPQFSLGFFLHLLNNSQVVNNRKSKYMVLYQSVVKLQGWCFVFVCRVPPRAHRHWLFVQSPHCIKVFTTVDKLVNVLFGFGFWLCILFNVQ